MKEKIQKIFPRRLLALAVVLAMAITLLPGMSMVAKADPNPMDSHTCYDYEYYDHFYVVSDSESEPTNKFKCHRYAYDGSAFNYMTEEDCNKTAFPEGTQPGGVYYYDTQDSKYYPCPDAYPVWVGKVLVTENNKTNVLGNNKVSYNDATKTLTLNGATISGGEGDHNLQGIKSEFPYGEKLTIELFGDNVIGRATDKDLSGGDERNPDKYGAETGIFVDQEMNVARSRGASGAVIFKGDERSSLSIYDRSAGIEAGDIDFESFKGNLTIYDYGAGMDCAINASGDIKINGGTYDLTSVESNGIVADGDVTIKNATINVSGKSGMGEGAVIYGEDVEITDSKVDVTVTGEYGIGIMGRNIAISENKSDITVTATANDKGASGIGCTDPCSISITGGKVRVKGFTYDIVALGDEEHGEYSEAALTIGSTAKPMTIKNAVRKDISGASTGEVVTEGAGGLAVYDGDSDMYIGILGAKDDSEYLVIESKGGNAGGYTPAPTITVPVENGSESTPVQAEIQGNVAVVKPIEDAVIADIVKKGTEDTIKIDVSAASSSVQGTALDKQTAEKIASVLSDTKNKIDTLEVKTPKATIALDAKALDTIAAAANASTDLIKLVVENTNKAMDNLSTEQQNIVEKVTPLVTVDAYALAGTVRVHDFKGGTMTVAIDYPFDSSVDTSKVKLLHMLSNGGVETLSWKKTQEGNRTMAVFSTRSLSYFAFVLDESGSVNPVTSEMIAKNTLKLNKGLQVSQTGSKVNVKWGKASADGYLVYASYCGKSLKKIKTITNPATTSYSFSKLDGKAIDLTKNIKVVVKAYVNVDGKKVSAGKTIGAHVIGENNTKYSNPKSITIAKKSVSLNVGKTYTVKATVNLKDASKNALPTKHVQKLRYASNNEAVATVNAAGKITAKTSGTATIYIYAANGYTKSVKVTVK